MYRTAIMRAVMPAYPLSLLKLSPPRPFVTHTACCCVRTAVPLPPSLLVQAHTEASAVRLVPQFLVTLHACPPSGLLPMSGPCRGAFTSRPVQLSN